LEGVSDEMQVADVYDVSGLIISEDKTDEFEGVFDRVWELAVLIVERKEFDLALKFTNGVVKLSK